MKIFKPGIYRFPALLLIFLCAAISGCGGLEKFDKQDIIIRGKAGEVKIKAEIARSDAQRQQGLMHRRQIKDGEGMIFIFEQDEVLSFWMKDTLVPLSIAYISKDGRILEIHDLEPGNLNPVRSSRSARYALEAGRGWFDRAGIGPGDILDTSGL